MAGIVSCVNEEHVSTEEDGPVVDQFNIQHRDGRWIDNGDEQAFNRVSVHVV